MAGRGILATYLLMRWFFLHNPILLFINMIYECGENEQVVIVTPKNVQFEDVSFFIRASDEERFLIF